MEPSDEFTYERLEWGKEDVRPRRLIRAPGWRSLKPGSATGRLVGGHLWTITYLAGTKYFPDFEDKILFWEDKESSTALTNQALWHFKMLGVFDKITGMLVGRVNPNDYRISSNDFDLYSTILDATREYDFPIIADMDFGHTEPIITLPYGIKASMDVAKLGFSMLESAVS